LIDAVAPSPDIAERNQSIESLLDRAAGLADWFQTIAAESDHERAFPEREFSMIAEAGLLAAPLPIRCGGAGLDGRSSTALGQLRLLKEMGRGNLSVGRVYEGHVNALMLIQTFGSDEQITRWAEDARDRRLLFGIWNTEAGDGVRITPLPDGRYQLTGAKTFCSGTGHVQRPVISGALPDGGWQMIVVPMERVRATIDPSWWRPIGMRASASYRVDFSDVIIEPSDLLGAPGDYHRQPWLSAGAIRFAAVQLGGAQALLDATCAFLRRLNRTGDPYQQQRIGQATIAVESGNLWLEGAAREVDLGPRAAEQDEAAVQRTIAYGNMLRLAVEEICERVIGIAQHSAGARALLQPDPIERIIRDLTLYLRQPAPDAALAQVGQFRLERDQ
jgi:alkylation response protein AidB-like acyl-CoA dehydrogenase